jgi:dipeptidyl aminopeptidase/acylaminoacyl peptidase
MGFDLTALLSVPVYRALDIDAEGRVLAATDESGSMQLIEIDPDGAATALTALPGACTGRYLPGSRAVLVAHDEHGNERTQLSLLRIGTGVFPVGLDGLEPIVRDPRYVHYLAEVTEARLCYLTNRRNGVDFDVVVRDLASGQETIGYAGGGYVDAAACSPDGNLVAFTLPGTPPMSDQIMVADLSSGEVRPLTGADEPAQHVDPRFTPDGTALIVTTDRGRDRLGVARLDLATAAWAWLAVDDDHDVTGWLSPDGLALLTSANVDGASVVSIHGPSGSDAVGLPGIGCVDGHPLPGPRWSPDGSMIVASFSGPGIPGDVLRIDAETGEVRQLTQSVSGLGGAAWPEPVSVQIPTPDGELIPCFVYRPAGNESSAVAGSSVVDIHGGPESQAKLVYDPVVAGLALAGHTVLVPNVRGSLGYGKRWYSLDDVRLRLDAVADLAAIHAYLPQLGLDQRLSALWGGSYGGYMVLAGVAFQPDLWAAGVDIVGISSLVTFLENTSPYRRSIREREYGSLEHDREFLASVSPLTRVGDIRAPLFVIHGANDPRVPVGEAEQLARALLANGVACELLVFSDEGHGLARRANRLEAYPRAFEFLAAHLRSPLVAPPDGPALAC